MGDQTGLAAEQLRALDRLKSIRGIEAFYLAGGSAIAIHLHHRRSLDLDLFSLRRDVDLDGIAAAASTAMPDFRVLSQSDVTLRATLGGVVVDMVRYGYPPLVPPAGGPVDFPIAGLRDLAAMKLAAISRRGLRRDFWDLHAICASGLSLTESAEAYLQRFGKAQSDLYHVLRALTYFEDAERETAMPAGLSKERWETIRRFFEDEAPRLLSTLP